MKNESMTVLQMENTSRRQNSKKLPRTRSLSQSRRAVKENRRPISDDMSDGRASDVVARLVPLTGTGGCDSGALLMPELLPVNLRSCFRKDSRLRAMKNLECGAEGQRDVAFYTVTARHSHNK